MNPASPPAASDRSQDPPDESAAPAPLDAHAKPTWRTRVRAGATAVLDAGNALRLRLGKKTGEIQNTEPEEDGRESAQDGPEAPQSASALPADTPAEAPPKRRLRAPLALAGILLAGCIGGGALAYTLFQQRLDQQLKDSQLREAALSQKIQSTAEIWKALEEEKAKRIEAETKLASAAAEYAKSTAEKQKELDAAEKHPAKLYIAEGPRTDGHGTHSLKSGDCTLDPKNIGALKRCIEEFNR